jgi:Uma2 family endonuclease
MGRRNGPGGACFVSRADMAAIAYDSKFPISRPEYEQLVRRGALEDAHVELLYGRIVSTRPGRDMAIAYEASRPGSVMRSEYEQLVHRGALDDAPVELLYGRLVSMSPQGEPHAYSVSQLMTLLVRALGERARVRVQAPFAASDDSEPEPDVAVVAPGNYLDGHPQSAALIVEVAETSLTRDRTKARLYAAAGVTEYWIVNLVDKVVEVHLDPRVGGYASVTSYRRGGVLRLVAFEDVVVSVADILPPTQQ